MSLVALKATAVTNADAAPMIKTSALIAAGKMREFVGTIAVPNPASIASTLRFCRVHSSWRVTLVKLYCDAVTSAAMDVGLYRTAADGGAVVDADFFASAQSIATAILTGTEIQHESLVNGVERIEQPLWQALGLTSDPGIFYDVTGTLTAASTAAGDVSLKVQCVEN